MDCFDVDIYIELLGTMFKQWFYMALQLVKSWLSFFGQVQSMEGVSVGVGAALLVVCISTACFFRRRKASVVPSGGCLDPKKFKEFKLVKKTQLNHNTSTFQFALPKHTSVLGLPVGQHVVCRGKDGQGAEVIRRYTPITLDSDIGFFELVVKMYPKGRMSHHFREMREGDHLAVQGPVGRFRYRPGQVGAFGMLAGGTGITPMFQVIRAILENPIDKTTVRLLYSNVTFQDILLKTELDGFASNFPGQFQVYYILSHPPSEWYGGIGHITKEIIQNHCPPPASDVQVLRCGPPGMNNAMAAHLNELNYTPVMQFEF